MSWHHQLACDDHADQALILAPNAGPRVSNRPRI
jgi:hypothetical protein